jgi:hypothetical protein
MHNPLAFDTQTPIGAGLPERSVDGSGCENEQTDPDFTTDEFAGEEA